MTTIFSLHWLKNVNWKNFRGDKSKFFLIVLYQKYFIFLSLSTIALPFLSPIWVELIFLEFLQRLMSEKKTSNATSKKLGAKAGYYLLTDFSFFFSQRSSVFKYNFHIWWLKFWFNKTLCLFCYSLLRMYVENSS